LNPLLAGRTIDGADAFAQKGTIMTQASDRPFDDFAPEADAVDQRRSVRVDDDEANLDTALADVQLRVSAQPDADEADLLEQAIVVPVDDDDLDFEQ
jgi:hypothetical protein